MKGHRTEITFSDKKYYQLLKKDIMMRLSKLLHLSTVSLVIGIMSKSVIGMEQMEVPATQTHWDSAHPLQAMPEEILKHIISFTDEDEIFQIIHRNHLSLACKSLHKILPFIYIPHYMKEKLSWDSYVPQCYAPQNEGVIAAKVKNTFHVHINETFYGGNDIYARRRLSVRNNSPLIKKTLLDKFLIDNHIINDSPLIDYSLANYSKIDDFLRDNPQLEKNDQDVSIPRPDIFHPTTSYVNDLITAGIIEKIFMGLSQADLFIDDAFHREMAASLSDIWGNRYLMVQDYVKRNRPGEDLLDYLLGNFISFYPEVKQVYIWFGKFPAIPDSPQDSNYKIAIETQKVIETCKKYGIVPKAINMEDITERKELVVTLNTTVEMALVKGSNSNNLHK